MPSQSSGYSYFGGYFRSIQAPSCGTTYKETQTLTFSCHCSCKTTHQSASAFPEFSHIVVLSNLPCHVTFKISNPVLQQCFSVTWLQQARTIPCQSRLLRATNNKGGEIRRFKPSVEHTQTLRSLSDTGQNGSSEAELQVSKCAKCRDKCTLFFICLGR